jgi:hypothetical protein
VKQFLEKVILSMIEYYKREGSFKCSNCCMRRGMMGAKNMASRRFEVGVGHLGG